MRVACPSRRELEELSKLMLVSFPARCRKEEKARLARARRYWELMGGA